MSLDLAPSSARVERIGRRRAASSRMERTVAAFAVMTPEFVARGISRSRALACAFVVEDGQLMLGAGHAVHYGPPLLDSVTSNHHNE
jgi:hypothetical protein